MIIWHNNRCSKSRCALEIIEEKNITHEIVNYLENPPSAKEIKAVLVKLGMTAEQIVRKGEAIFKENFKGKEMTEDQWIEALTKYPKLIERPIVIKGNKAVIGRPPENVLGLI
jgi:arsenate reductase (glutaredoxin)